jgi:hypothetical protein
VRSDEVKNLLPSCGCYRNGQAVVTLFFLFSQNAANFGARSRHRGIAAFCTTRHAVWFQSADVSARYIVSTNARADPLSQVRSSQWFPCASRRRDEKLIKIGPLEVPKRNNSREKLQLERPTGNAMFASARIDVWDYSDFATPSISSSRFASL